MPVRKWTFTSGDMPLRSSAKPIITLLPSCSSRCTGTFSFRRIYFMAASIAFLFCITLLGESNVIGPDSPNQVCLPSRSSFACYYVRGGGGESQSFASLLHDRLSGRKTYQCQPKKSRCPFCTRVAHIVLFAHPFADFIFGVGSSGPSRTIALLDRERLLKQEPLQRRGRIKMEIKLKKKKKAASEH